MPLCVMQDISYICLFFPKLFLLGLRQCTDAFVLSLRLSLLCSLFPESIR